MWGTVAVYLVVKLCSTLHDPMDYSPLVPLSMGFPKQEYWSGLPFPAPGDLPHPGIKPTSSALADRFFTTEPPGGYWVANLTTPTKRPEAYWNSWHGGIGGSHLTLSFCITKVSRYNSLAHPLSSSTLPLSPRGEICTCLVLSDFFFLYVQHPSFSGSIPEDILCVPGSRGQGTCIPRSDWIAKSKRQFLTAYHLQDIAQVADWITLQPFWNRGPRLLVQELWPEGQASVLVCS